jgi:hypothetical protein
MPEPKPRLNAYAETVAPLVDARQESMVKREPNQRVIAIIEALLKDKWPTVLHRGWWGEIRFTVSIEDGILMSNNIILTEQRIYRS